MQITHGIVEIEVRKDHRPHHAPIEMGGDELSHAVGINRLEQPLLDAFTNDLREQLALLDVEALDGVGDVRIAFVRCAEIERYLHEAVNLGIFVDVIGEPRSDNRRRIGALVIQGAHVLEGAGDGMLDRGTKQIGLAVEIVIDQRGVDAKRAGNVLDRDRCEVPLGEQIQGYGKEIAFTREGRKAISRLG